MPHDSERRRDRRRGGLGLELESLPREARAAMEALLAGDEVVLRRDGLDVGVLTLRPSVREGVVMSGPHTSSADGEASASFAGDSDRVPTPVPAGVTVVASATQLSDAARRRLSDALGPDYIVLDLLQAPPTADVLLTHPVSPQLLGALRGQFPNARIIVTEIDDPELGVSQPGPVSRLLDAGACAYLPPRPLREVATSVHAYLTGSDAPQLTTGPISSVATVPAAALPAAALPTTALPKADLPSLPPDAAP